jgi:hypothetical protein
MKPNSRSDTCINWARILLQRMQGFKDYPEEFAVAPELLRPLPKSPGPSPHDRKSASRFSVSGTLYGESKTRRSALPTEAPKNVKFSGNSDRLYESAIKINNKVTRSVPFTDYFVDTSIWKWARRRSSIF